MSGGETETPVGGEAAAGGGDKKRDSLGTAGSPAHLIIKGTEREAYRPGGFQRSPTLQAAFSDAGPDPRPPQLPEASRLWGRGKAGGGFVAVAGLSMCQVPLSNYGLTQSLLLPQNKNKNAST